MGQINAKLRSIEGAHFAHWCPGCLEMHRVPKSWSFDGNLVVPTVTPSVKITGKKHIVIDGKWTGEWERGPDGKALDRCCHYILTAGVLHFCGDCTHALSGSNVALPDLPAFVSDDIC